MAPYEHFKAPCLLNVPLSLIFTNSTFCPHNVSMCCVWISGKKKQQLFPYTALTDWFLDAFAKLHEATARPSARTE